MFKRFCFVLALIFAFPINAYASDNMVSAYSYITVDSGSLTVLSSNNAYEKLAMASTTKIMTCLLACESGKLNTVVTVTDEMVDTEGSSIYLESGDKITLMDLVKGAMLASGNDAANAIAITLAGSADAFAVMMNERAKEIGMYDTVFVTPSGLDKGEHHSTAYDMALLTCEAVQNKIFLSVCSLKSAEITVNSKKATIYNHNKLLNSDSNYVGVKTGFTEKAGRCLVSAYKYKGNIIVCVTLNAPDDWDDHKKLISSAKSKYITVHSDDKYTINVVGGVKQSVECSANCTVSCVSSTYVKVRYYPFAYAPVKKGDALGEQIIYSNGRIIKKTPVKAVEDIDLWQETTK
ncbi:MAG: D-alanyl-D-alanine carboxypeptidase family protein [Eubacterium sp.]